MINPFQPNGKIEEQAGKRKKGEEEEKTQLGGWGLGIVIETDRNIPNHHNPHE